MKCTLVLSLLALASADFLEKKTEASAEAMEKKMAQEQSKGTQAMESYYASHVSAQFTAMKSQSESQLAYYQTEQGQLEHEKSLQALRDAEYTQAAEDMQWFADVARDGSMDFGYGMKFPLMDASSPLGKLPKGLPDFPKDPEKYAAFIQTLPVEAGEYSVMLDLKKEPSKYLKVEQEKIKKVASSLLEEKVDTKHPEAMIQSQDKSEDKQQKSIEIIKASPKAFKTALKAWEKIVPEAASMLLQTEDAQLSQAKELAKKATALHQTIFDSLTKVDEKDKLMSVAQNRITSMLMRQSEAALGDFDALDGCTAAAKDYSGAEARCLCVADNICSKVGQAHSGNYCSVVSSATCMTPRNEQEATEMATV